MRTVGEKEALVGRPDPESECDGQRRFAYGALPGSGGFVGNSDSIQARVCRFVGLILFGSRPAAVLAGPQLRWFRLS